MKTFIVSRRQVFAVGLALSAAMIGLAPQPVQAAFPERPIKIIVPYPAGGGTDAIARSLAEALSKDLGQTVLVDNKPGAGTVLGNDFVSKSPADGYTLLINTSSFSIVPSLVNKLPYAGEAAFAPVAQLGRAPNMVLVSAKSRFKTAKDLVAFLKSNPGKLTYGSAGNGTTTHLAAESLKNVGKLDMLHVPYKGASPMITDLVGGQIDMGFATQPSAVGAMASGKLRLLAVTSGARSPAWPDTPTLAESGVPGYDAEVWYGIFAPAGTPAAVIKRLNDALRKAAQVEPVRRQISNEGLILSISTPEELGRLARAEEQRWKKLVKEQGISSD